jgi:phosphotransferase system HPr (HPr) family protein
MAELHLTVIDPAGLHARPAAKLVKVASRFESRIVLRSGERTVDVKSLIALLGLTVRPLAEITLVADGPDADDALAALVQELGAAVALSSDGAGAAVALPPDGAAVHP